MAAARQIPGEIRGLFYDLGDMFVCGDMGAHVQALDVTQVKTHM